MACFLLLAGRSKGWGIVEFETPEEVRFCVGACFVPTTAQFRFIPLHLVVRS